MEADSPSPTRLPSEVTNEGVSDMDSLVKPAVLIFAGQSIVSVPSVSAASKVVSATPIPVYQMSWDVTSIPQKGSSAVFERVEEGKVESAITTIDDDQTEKETNSAPPTTRRQKRQHLFYLAHLADAQFQKENPAYYLTTVLPTEMLGNISLEPMATSSGVQFPGKKRPTFKAFLHAGKSARDTPLFAAKSKTPQLLFEASPMSRAKRWMGNGSCSYTWTDSKGNQVAYEEDAGKGSQRQRKLVIATSMEGAKRDALVATWCLGLWHDTAESKEARREALQRWTPPESAWGLAGNGDKMAKRGNALMGFAAGGGGAGC
ncbi:MAG: hypothetical protein Q9160_007563 [Pyrenula sp. 1 TL-2023]